MTDVRRGTPEPPPGPPKIRLAPGMAKDLLRDRAPPLAEEGIDVDNIEVPDLATLRRAMDRAVGRGAVRLGDHHVLDPVPHDVVRARLGRHHRLAAGDPTAPSGETVSCVTVIGWGCGNLAGVRLRVLPAV